MNKHFYVTFNNIKYKVAGVKGSMFDLRRLWFDSPSPFSTWVNKDKLLIENESSYLDIIKRYFND